MGRVFLNVNRMFLNVNNQIQEPYDQGFSSNSNVTVGILKLSSAESVFDLNHPASEFWRRPLVCPE